MTTTYLQLSEKIRTTFARGVANQDFNFSLMHIAQLISEEVAAAARQNAFENSNQGETTYSNDTFIVTFKNIAVQYDSVLKYSYVPLPSLPTALPSNQEIQKIWPVGARKKTIIYISNKSKFSQDLLPPMRGYITSFIENGNLIIDNPTAFSFDAVNINMIGAMPNGDLLSQQIMLPKSYEPMISEKVIARLLQTSARPRDIINDNTAIPS